MKEMDLDFERRKIAVGVLDKIAFALFVSMGVAQFVNPTVDVWRVIVGVFFSGVFYLALFIILYRGRKK